MKILRPRRLIENRQKSSKYQKCSRPVGPPPRNKADTLTGDVIRALKGSFMAASPSKRLTFLCPSCGAKFEFAANMAGRSGKCARCGHLFTVPESASAPANSVERKVATPSGKSLPEF